MLGEIRKSIKKITIVTSLAIVLMVIFLFGLEAKAVSIDLTVSGGLGTKSLTVIIGQIIQVVLGFLGVIALGLALYAGFLWMTAQGNEEKINQAKKILVNAAIGLAIILSAFAIVSFLINQLIDATTNVPGGGQGANNPGFPGSALGGGILESVYPLPNSINNPRNTLIMAMFKESVTNIIDPTNLPGGNICDGYTPGINCGYLMTENGQPDGLPNVKIYPTSEPDNFLAANAVVVKSSNSQKNFSFDPVALLGNENTPTNYTVILTDRILKQSGGIAIAGGFDWAFEISTFVDLTPPTVTYVFPEQSTTVARNAIVQINFSEAMAVTTVSGGTQTGFNNITLTYDDNGTLAPVQGNYNVGNLFKTVEFLSSEPCGGVNNINSCGNTVYCLPGQETFTGTVTTNVTDAAGNALANQYNDPPWTFDTSNELDLTAPNVVFNPALDPYNTETLIPLNYANINVNGVTANFNEAVSALTVNTTNYLMIKDTTECTAESIAQPNQYGQYPGINNIYPSCWPGGFGVSLGSSSSQVKLFVYPPLSSLTGYNPRLLSYITDMYQNCFIPAVQQ